MALRGALLVTAGLLVACGSGDENSPVASEVVVVGYETSATPLPDDPPLELISRAAWMWVNGVEYALPAGSDAVVEPPGRQLVATSVTFGTRNEVVVGGNVDVGGLGVSGARLWRNGEVVVLPVSVGSTFAYSRVNAVSANATDIFAAGVHAPTHSCGKAIVWQSGSPIYLTDRANDANCEEAMAIAVSGADVHVAGHAEGIPTIALYWKNGVRQALSDRLSLATAVATFGDDVYVAGYVDRPESEADTAVVWKNGTPQYLPDGTSSHAVTASVSGDVYVAGIARRVDAAYARLWRNGEPQMLEGAGRGSSANAVYTLGNDVYVAGSVSGGGKDSTAVLWVNGKLQRLSAVGRNFTAKGVVVR